MATSDKSYSELKQITDQAYATQVFDKKVARSIVQLLGKYGKKLRQDDGKLHQLTVSIPTSRADAIVIGLRYIKQDTTYTEDHFLFEIDQPIVYHPGKRLEKILPEYKGTHKIQL